MLLDLALGIHWPERNKAKKGAITSPRCSFPRDIQILVYMLYFSPRLLHNIYLRVSEFLNKAAAHSPYLPPCFELFIHSRQYQLFLSKSPHT